MFLKLTILYKFLQRYLATKIIYNSGNKIRPVLCIEMYIIILLCASLCIHNNNGRSLWIDLIKYGMAPTTDHPIFKTFGYSAATKLLNDGSRLAANGHYALYDENKWNFRVLS